MYRLNYAQSVEGLDDVQFYVTDQNYFLFPNLEAGVWYWQVTAIDADGHTTKSPVWSFTVNGEVLSTGTDPVVVELELYIFPDPVTKKVCEEMTFDT